MKLLADESVERQIVERLRLDGHDVLYVAEMEPGIGDPLVLQRANEHEALLITGDKDFGELVYRLRQIHRGVVLIRLAGASPIDKAQMVSEVLAQRGPEIPENFTVISPTQLRIRRAQSENS